ncbi:hypothetical protein HMI54_004747 [Coelomomyces lativittatus]|nr:hypothetical protein HMI54_004747 [Coelomomyces lativittatus]
MHVYTMDDPMDPLSAIIQHILANSGNIVNVRNSTTRHAFVSGTGRPSNHELVSIASSSIIPKISCENIGAILMFLAYFWHRSQVCITSLASCFNWSQ